MLNSDKVFASFLKKFRKKRKITQEQLATSINVSTVYIHQLETAKVDAPSKEKCEAIADALNAVSYTHLTLPTKA